MQTKHKMHTSLDGVMPTVVSYLVYTSKHPHQSFAPNRRFLAGSCCGLPVDSVATDTEEEPAEVEAVLHAEGWPITAGLASGDISETSLPAVSFSTSALSFGVNFCSGSFTLSSQYFKAPAMSSARFELPRATPTSKSVATVIGTWSRTE